MTDGVDRILATFVCACGLMALVSWDIMPVQFFIFRLGSLTIIV